MKTGIVDQSEEQNEKISAEQENVLSNVKMLIIKRGELLEQFARNNIISKNEKCFDATKKIEKAHYKNHFLR